VKVLLDENFPLGLVRRLQADGLVAEHIITLGWRGASDARIREQLQDDGLLFLTQDEDFLFGATVPAVVVISRVRQARPLKERIEIWRAAVSQLVQQPRAEGLFELTDDGILLPWRDVQPSGPR
jgi:Domain of unknown function (DUF5615)